MTTDLLEPAASHGAGAAPGTATETRMAELLEEVAGVEDVSVESHFFDDLGVDSMVMARFCALVRKREDLPPVSIKEVYEHPTIRSLAAALEDAHPNEAEPPAEWPIEPAPKPAGTAQYVLCGALQLLAFLAYVCGAALLIAPGYEWISASSGLADAYLRAILVGGAAFAAASTVPILAKWALIGRWKPQQRIRIWSLAYVRFWIVKTLVRTSPLVLFAGTPIYALYLRALGAKVGPGALILSRKVPVCADLLTVGAGAVVRKDSFLNCYRARAGVIETGTVALGENAFVGEAAVLDIETSLGDRAQLGHASALHAGQSVPAGERRHGSPAQRTEVDHRAVDPAPCSALRRTVYSVSQLASMLALYLPLAIGGVALLIAAVPQLASLAGSGGAGLTSPAFYLNALVVSFGVFFGTVLAGLLFVGTVPRLLNLAIKPDRLYPLYGFHYGVHRAIGRITNAPFFPRLLGDSSYIVHYLRFIGYDLSRVEQTGSNFGLEVKHENPFLCSVGTGTMAADGLSIMNADFSDTSFRVSRTRIGANSFLGNYVAYPSRGKSADNCLLATKVMVPVDGDSRKGVGLLGSPSFEIPRSVKRDGGFDHLRKRGELRRRLAAKNRHNAVTIGLYLLMWWTFFFGVTVLAGVAVVASGAVGAVAFGLAGALALAFRLVLFGLAERLSTAFRDLRPQYCSIYDPYFWWHERFWKLSMQPLVLDGTPFKSLAWRLLGVRIGKRVFDDGCAIVEKTLVTIGDDCALNARSIIQAHSQEDGAFKSDRIAVGSGCTLGTASLVHYGVTMGDGVVLAPDSFLMKGAEVPNRARWGGNPARAMRAL